ncbi:TPA: hypothetical protein ACJJ8T_001745 [Neisseria meningitidis]|nr:hypothetical protein [Neisseria meningitidis]
MYTEKETPNGGVGLLFKQALKKFKFPIMINLMQELFQDVQTSERAF